jgi:hypothetical protein
MNGSEGLERLKPGGAPGRSVRQHWRWLRTLFRLPAWPLLARMGAFSKRSRGFWPWRSCVCFNGADLERFPAVLPELPSRTQLRIRPATLASVQSAFSTGTLRVICRFTWMNNVNPARMSSRCRSGNRWPHSRCIADTNRLLSQSPTIPSSPSGERKE